MARKNGKIKIQDERVKRQASAAQLNAAITKGEQQLNEWRAALLKNIGALEQLDELEGIKPPDPSDNGVPVKKKDLEQKES
jgi:hypothetical protein